MPRPYYGNAKFDFGARIEWVGIVLMQRKCFGDSCR
jgi:hypothetical protein